MGVSLWCVHSHRALVLISTQIISKGETLVLLVHVVAELPLVFRVFRSRSEGRRFLALRFASCVLYLVTCVLLGCLAAAL